MHHCVTFVIVPVPDSAWQEPLLLRFGRLRDLPEVSNVARRTIVPPKPLPSRSMFDPTAFPESVIELKQTECVKKADPETIPFSSSSLREMPTGSRSAGFIVPANDPDTSMRAALHAPVSPFVQPPAAAV